MFTSHHSPFAFFDGKILVQLSKNLKLGTHVSAGEFGSGYMEILVRGVAFFLSLSTSVVKAEASATRLATC